MPSQPNTRYAGKGDSTNGNPHKQTASPHGGPSTHPRTDANVRRKRRRPGCGNTPAV